MQKWQRESYSDTVFYISLTAIRLGISELNNAEKFLNSSIQFWVSLHPLVDIFKLSVGGNSNVALALGFPAKLLFGLSTN